VKSVKRDKQALKYIIRWEIMASKKRSE